MNICFREKLKKSNDIIIIRKIKCDTKSSETKVKKRLKMRKI